MHAPGDLALHDAAACRWLRRFVRKILVRYAFSPAAAKQSIRIPAGKARLGAKFRDLPFGWDNEFGEVVVDVPAFTMDSLPVTNGEFHEFVSCGAYDRERYWLAADWRWKNLENKKYPACWVHQEGIWFYRGMFDQFALEKVASWPVYVSLAEARAYAQWRGKRLPREAEFHRAAYYDSTGRESMYPWGDAAPSQRHGNFDFAAWSPLPVGSSPAGASCWGVAELVGNGWELTDTPFAPLPGFTPYMTSYPDYSKDFFDGKHFVVKGASWATDASLLRPSFRNWYQAHYPYVFAKFRCVDRLTNRRGATNMKATWENTIIAESNDTIVVENNHYFPPDSIKQDCFTPSATHTTCPWKGLASYYNVKVGEKVNPDAAWFYPEPKDAAKQIKNYVAFWRGVQVSE